MARIWGTVFALAKTYSAPRITGKLLYAASFLEQFWVFGIIFSDLTYRSIKNILTTAMPYVK